MPVFITSSITPRPPKKEEEVKTHANQEKKTRHIEQKITIIDKKT